MSTVITDKNSIISLVQNSTEFRQWFALQKRNQRMRVGDKVHNFSMAKRRYDSLTKPVSRAALNYVALVKIAQQIVLLRRGVREVQSARNFLKRVATENIVLLAMLADAGQEAIQLLRTLDREDAPTEDIPFLLEAMLQKISMLFVDGQVVHCGHTHWVLQSLKFPVLVRAVREVGAQAQEMQPQILGSSRGVPGHIINKALERMSAWVKLAHEVVQAEFPDFRALSAFSVFSLTPGNHKGLSLIPIVRCRRS